MPSRQNLRKAKKRKYRHRELIDYRNDEKLFELASIVPCTVEGHGKHDIDTLANIASTTHRPADCCQSTKDSGWACWVAKVFRMPVW